MLNKLRKIIMEKLCEKLVKSVLFRKAMSHASRWLRKCPSSEIFYFLYSTSIYYLVFIVDNKFKNIAMFYLKIKLRFCSETKQKKTKLFCDVHNLSSFFPCSLLAQAR